MLHVLYDGFLRIHHTGIDLSEMVDEEGGSGSRRLDTLVGNHIEHAFVSFVTDSRDDRQREVGHILGKCQGVEARKVAGGSSSSDDDHAIVFLPFGIDAIQGSDDALLHSLPLHRGRKETGGELQTVVVIG